MRVWFFIDKDQGVLYRLDIEEAVLIDVVEIEGPWPVGPLFPSVVGELYLGIDFVRGPLVDLKEFLFDGRKHSGGFSESEVEGFVAGGANGHEL